MSYQFLTIRRDGPVEHVTLNRPEVRNAFNEEVIGELAAWAEGAADDPGLRVVVSPGAGKVVLRRRRRGVDGEDGRLRATRRTCATRALAAGMFRALDALPGAVIGRIHGAALGGGAGLAAVCDIVVAAEHGDVRLHRDEARHPAGDDLAVRAAEDRRLGGARAVPDRRAVHGARAKEIGLVHAVVPEAELDATVDRYVAEMLSAAPTAVAAAKRLMPQVWRTARRRTSPTLTADAIAEQRVSPEGQEGLRAFLEKRKPEWA